MPHNLEEVEFTIIDTETTGLDPLGGDRVIELAGIRFKGDTKITSFHTFINPQRMVSPAAFAVNKISDQMLADAPRAEAVLPQFLVFVQSSCLCSYNLPFDLGFLDMELKRVGLCLSNTVALIDILTMARKLLPRLERHALWFVAQELAIAGAQQHRALADVEMAWQVFRHLKKLLAEKGIADFRQIVSLFGLRADLTEDINAQKRAKIQEAIEEGLRLKIKYFSRSSADVSEREVIPKEIFIDRKQAYLVGFCCLRNEERTFRIDHIVDIATL